MSDESAPIPFILGVDVEPDKPEADPRESRAPWVGFERWVAHVRDLRPRLAEATAAPVHVTWLLRMDPQVARIHGSPAWVADRYGRELAEMRAAGDCLGLHPHAWRWQDPPGRWLADHGDPAWVEETMRLSFRTYAAR